MAKFCTKCGKETVDGVCPDCKEVKTEVVATESVDIKQSFMDCLEVVKGIFTKPFDTIKSFVADNKFVTGIILIILTALSGGIYRLAGLKIAANDFYEPEYLKEFMTTFVTDVAEYALIAFVGYLVVTMLFKGTATIKEMLSAVGVSLAVVLLVNLLNSILIFVDIDVVQDYIMGYIFSFGTFMNILLLSLGIYQASKMDKNKLFISVTSIMIFSTIVIDIFNKLFN